jgi:ATP-dependent RNA helicase DeaD
MDSFKELNLPEDLIQSLDAMGITKPTPIQASSIGPAMDGHDLLASAQTGSGKTLAFLLPLVMHLTNNPQGKALILVPTRELATQVRDSAKKLLGAKSKLNLALLIGGDSMFRQLKELKANPRILIGTPGRVTDHIMRGSLKLNDAHFLVLDEADRMLDMGFDVQLEKIAKHLPRERQTMMFSATIMHNVTKLADRYLQDPVRVEEKSNKEDAPKIKQEMVQSSHENKFQLLVEQLNEREGAVIIFVKTKRGTEQLAKQLQKANHSAEAIHGDLRQSKRDRVIKNMRNNTFRILVATDVAARGIDIPHIRHVINFHLPMCPEDYIHRIGRTARAGLEGCALSFVAPDERHIWRAIHRLMNPGESLKIDGFTGGTGPRNFARKSSSSGPYKPFSQRRSGSIGYGSREGSREKSDGFRDGPRKSGFKRDGFKSDGFKSNGFKKEGARSEGFRSGPKSEGFRSESPRTEGTRRSTFSTDGYKTERPNRDGFKRDGFAKPGFKKEGSKRDSFGKDSFSKSGPRKDGFKKTGFKKSEPKENFATKFLSKFKSSRKKSYAN